MTKTLIYNISLWLWDDIDEKSRKGSSTCSNSWIVSEGGKILAIGYDNPPLTQAFEEVIDGAGNLALPGLIDSHIHVEMTGESQYFLDLSSCDSIDDLVDKLSLHTSKYPDLTWIQGINWDQSKLGRYPTRQDLDRGCNDRPVFLWRACWHIGVANTFAFDVINIDLHSGEYFVEGGVVDVIDSVPTGIFRERAVELVSRVMNTKSPQQRKAFITEGLNLCASMGLTSVQTNDENAYEIYKELLDENKIPIRVFLTPTQAELSLDREISRIHPQSLNDISSVYSFDSKESLFVIDRVKIFSDGSLGAETAAMRQQGSASIRGVLIQNDDQLLDMIMTAKRKQYRVEIHAIGDAAADQVLTAMERAELSPDDRPIITHCQILGEDLVARMKLGGVISNIQPSFVPTDMRWVKERISGWQQPYAYAWKTLLDNDIHLAGGSDSPIESCSPFVGIHDAIFRRGRGEASNETYRSEEKLTFAEALWIYTVGGAYAGKAEECIGAIKVGHACDLVLVDPAILTNNECLATIRPRVSIVGGRPVHTLPLDKRSSTMGGPFIPGKAGPKWGFMGCSFVGCRCSILPSDSMLGLQQLPDITK